MMGYSGLFFIPNSTNDLAQSSALLTSLANSIESRFELATRGDAWSLVHRLLRAVPTPNTQPQSTSYQHIFRLTYLNQNKTYCYIHPFTPPAPGTSIKTEAAGGKQEGPSNAGTPQASQGGGSGVVGQGTMISIPAAQTESHTSFLVTQLSPLWAFRHALNVPQGISYHIGSFTIYLGAINASRSGPQSGSATISPGVVCCISTITSAGDDARNLEDEGYNSVEGSSVNAEGEQEEIKSAEEEVRGLWDTIKKKVEFGKSEVREVMMGKDALTNKDGEAEAIVRMWCEVLRLRG